MAEESEFYVENFNIVHWVQLLWQVSFVIAHN
jgi:hypothetical protein